ncbi:uncharacterized protein TRIADDRAFT_56540 [Trichoplax adhaerens]|uniref:Biogenesis of lysosome-related organelles complex 1 subunit 3 n=1 Tax=Trichoplax adhaerens TaxID=10228 RepID=B3RYF5_TRIAD|nr:hypothetical protein TRIADDRAFT_56540 [Trichoplax adhaerens]EDV24589.1 hypothetical protein TRIADDRAFT_56540 [Trichoplax adhaerens]|eukprot:XP_002112479.1 hypothetical protein TRIADDRAFT_56540 [Trichoplax adhaerens]
MSTIEIQGEGSESEEEIAISQQLHSCSNTQSTVNPISSHGTIVAGEASESEDDQYPNVQPAQTVHPQKPRLTADTDQQSKSTISNDNTVSNEPISPASELSETQSTQKQEKTVRSGEKYDTLLHRKLREKNLQLRNEINARITDMYSNANYKLEDTVNQICKTQSVLQDISQTVHTLKDDAVRVNNAVDIQFFQSFLPDVKI